MFGERKLGCWNRIGVRITVSRDNAEARKLIFGRRYMPPAPVLTGRPNQAEALKHKDRPGWKPDGLWSDGSLGLGIASGRGRVALAVDRPPARCESGGTDSPPDRRADNPPAQEKRAVVPHVLPGKLAHQLRLARRMGIAFAPPILRADRRIGRRSRISF